MLYTIYRPLEDLDLTASVAVVEASDIEKTLLAWFPNAVNLISQANEQWDTITDELGVAIEPGVPTARLTYNQGGYSRYEGSQYEEYVETDEIEVTSPSGEHLALLYCESSEDRDPYDAVLFAKFPQAEWEDC